MTSAASFALKSEASNLVMGPIPCRPAARLSHMDAISFPTGVTAPSPVTTTLFISIHLALIHIARPPSIRITSPVI